MKYILGILFLFGLTVLVAQQPAYFTIGEEELKNEQIYSIYQGEDEIIYTTTNNGIFAYEHGKFRKLPLAKEQIGTSLFGLKEDYDGNLYCFNLSGQIFKVENFRLILVFTVPKAYRHPTYEYCFAEDNRLVIKGYILIVVETENWEIVYAYDDVEGSVTYIGENRKGEILFNDTKSIFRYKNGEIIKERIFPLEDRAKSIRQTFIIADTEYYVFRDEGKYVIKKHKGSLGIPNIQVNIDYAVVDLKETLAFLDQKKGLLFLQADENKNIKVESWFSEQFISHINTGTDGKILLGTFNNGIHIVPNPDVYIDEIVPKETECRTFCVDNDTLYLVFVDNNIYRYDGQRELLKGSENPYPINHIFHVKNVNLFNDDLVGLLFRRTGKHGDILGVLKDVYQKKNGDLILARNDGINYYSTTEVHSKRWKPHLKYLKKYKYFCQKKFQRVTKISYSEKKDIVYTINSGLLEGWDSLNHLFPIFYNENRIRGTDLENDEDTIYVATYDQGILRIEDKKAIPFFNKENGLANSHVRQIEIENKQLFVLHSDGLQVFDMASELSHSVGLKEGVDSKSIRNFAVEGNHLWLNTGANITKINIDEIKQEEEDFELQLDSISMNEKKIGNNIQYFNHKENNIVFYTNFKNILLEDETELWYKLDGVEDKWERTYIHNYLIQYKSLSPGKYTFRAFAQFRNQRSKEIIYSFKIFSPFWQRWWFYPLMISILGFIMYQIFKNREKQIKEINQASLAKETAEREQIEAELKALRSQMNPHFIFNSLNSIQDLILREETDKSYDYIVLFAELVRNTLNYSNKKMILIEKELDFLEVYLSLEKLRFSENFKYDIKYDGNKDIEIPSLLVQPFIENALLHGLLHKKGEKHISIHFKMINKIFSCTIIDNGIGRKKSQELKSKYKPHHTSFAMNAIEKRLGFLSQQYGIDAKYEVIDLYEKEKPLGTKVIIQMPYMEAF